MLQAVGTLPSREVRERAVRLLAADGTELGATAFEPERRPLSTVVIHSATGVPAGYYARFARWLAGAGHRVLTYDYRGIGASRAGSLRGYRASMTDWAELDARAAHAWARTSSPELPTVLVGHSFGGRLLGLIDEARDVAGAVLVAAQFGYYGHWPLPGRMKLGLAWHLVVPSLTRSFGYLPGKAGIGEDLPAGVAEEWARWCLHPEYLLGYHEDARDRFARYDRPVLWYAFSDDDYGPRRAVDALVTRLENAPVMRRRVRPGELGLASIGHFGFFRPKMAETLWPETLAFIDDVVAGRPTRDDRKAGAWGVTEEDVMADLAYGRS